ncbi:actin-bundling T4SS effector WalE1 family protein [Candidatus Wolbachia massiliensis]|uniref:Uncharacterized protein n=1 Tax=Candidatus Wolbachia massiliensis TaxID=1845000 RepID=A0A7L7YLX2_9RICK|nr:hypothetical protein [Candidatus Wolbachia massiliensis]QOD38058.1 hypothetical protein ID128_04485 [Candidatus Wolbachia massiliensis]
MPENNTSNTPVVTPQENNSNLDNSAVNISPAGTPQEDKALLDTANHVAPTVDPNNKKSVEKVFHKIFQKVENFSELPAKEQMLIVMAASALFTAVLPIALAAAAVGIAGAVVGSVSFLCVKAVQHMYKGLKWSAEKTVEGAKYIAKEIEKGAVYLRDLIKEAMSSVGQATREGTSAAFTNMGRKLSNLGASMSNLDEIPYSIDDQDQTVVLKTEEKTKDFNNIKEMFTKEVLEDKAVNSSVLTKEIFSKLREKILVKGYSVDGQQSAKKDQSINRLKQQVDFVKELNAKKLQNLLSQGDNRLYEIFSEHHDEIKRIIGECKEDHKLSKSPEGSRRSSVSTTDSTAGLLNPDEHKKVKTPTSFKDRMSSLFKRGNNSKPEVGQTLSGQDTSPRKEGNSTFYATPEQPPRSSSMGSVSSSTPKEFATVKPNLLRRRSLGDLSSLEKVDSPKLSRSASLSDLNRPVVASDGGRTLSHSSSIDSLASNDSYYSTTSESGEDDMSKSSSDSGKGSSGSSTPNRQGFSEINSGEAKARLRKTGYWGKNGEWSKPSPQIDGSNAQRVTPEQQEVK